MKDFERCNCNIEDGVCPYMEVDIFGDTYCKKFFGVYCNGEEGDDEEE